MLHLLFLLFLTLWKNTMCETNLVSLLFWSHIGAFHNLKNNLFNCLYYYRIALFFFPVGAYGNRKNPGTGDPLYQEICPPARRVARRAKIKAIPYFCYHGIAFRLSVPHALRPMLANRGGNQGLPGFEMRGQKFWHQKFWKILRCVTEIFELVVKSFSERLCLKDVKLHICHNASKSSI